MHIFWQIARERERDVPSEIILIIILVRLEMQIIHNLRYGDEMPELEATWPPEIEEEIITISLNAGAQMLIFGFICLSTPMIHRHAECNHLLLFEHLFHDLADDRIILSTSSEESDGQIVGGRFMSK